MPALFPEPVTYDPVTYENIFAIIKLLEIAQTSSQITHYTLHFQKGFFQRKLSQNKNNYVKKMVVRAKPPVSFQLKYLFDTAPYFLSSLKNCSLHYYNSTKY